MRGEGDITRNLQNTLHLIHLPGPAPTQYQEVRERRKSTAVKEKREGGHDTHRMLCLPAMCFGCAPLRRMRPTLADSASSTRAFCKTANKKTANQSVTVCV